MNIEHTILAAMFLLIVPVLAFTAGNDHSLIDQGREITIDRKKGNCLACHAIDNGELPGNLAPPLVNIQSRFPDKSLLRAQIWDATQRNPMTIMPPFGKHKILTEEEIDKIVEYMYSL